MNTMLDKYKCRVQALFNFTDAFAADHVKYSNQWYTTLSERAADFQKQNDFIDLIPSERKLNISARAQYQKELETLQDAILSKKLAINNLKQKQQDLKNEFLEIDNSCKTLEKSIEKKLEKIEEKKELLKLYRRLTGVDFNLKAKMLTGYTYNASKSSLRPFALNPDEVDKNRDYLWAQLEKQFL